MAWALQGRLAAGLAIIAATPVAAALACARDGEMLAVLGALTLAAVLCAAWITRDVFALVVRTRREMIAHQGDLEAAKRDLEQMRTALTHELGPQAQVIDGFTRVLETAYASQLDREALRMLSKVRGSAVLLRRGIEGLLERPRE